MVIFEKDLAELALNGLRSHIKERLEGYEFLTVNQVLQRALAQESRSKESKFKPDRLSMHMLQGESSDDEGNEVYAAEFVWSSSDKPSTCTSLKPISKNRQDEIKFTFDVTKCDRIFDELAKLGKIKFSHTIPSTEELKRRAYCKLHNTFSHATNDCNVLRRQIQSAINEGRLVVPAMQIDQNPFPVHTLELSNPKVLIRPHQTESTKGKNVVVGEERHEKKVLQSKTPRVATEVSTLGGQDKEKGADSESTGLTGSKGGLTGLTGSRTGLTDAPSKSGNSSKIKTRPSFNELLAKYEKEGSAQRQKGRPSEVKDTGSSSRHQEQSSQGNYTSSSGPISPWYCWYPYFYTPMDYSRMNMQSYYIQHPPMYPNHALLQRLIVASNNPVKQDVDCSKENEKRKE